MDFECTIACNQCGGSIMILLPNDPALDPPSVSCLLCVNTVGELNPVTIEDRIYCLQKTQDLPHELRDMLMKADKAYIQDRDSEALAIIQVIELECQTRGVTIYRPTFF